MKHDLKKIKKIVFVGHDNEGSAKLLDAIAGSFTNCQFLLIEGKGLYYKKTLAASIIKLLKEASWLFVTLRFYEIIKFKIFGTSLINIARRYSIRVIKSYDINSADTLSHIKQFAPDLLVSLFTMQIYKQEIINLPRYGSITSHPSILPSYRGLEVFFWVLANNESETGVSIFFLTPRIDEGRVIWQQTIKIDKQTTVNSLYQLITHIGSVGLVNSIINIDNDDVIELPQNGISSYYPMPNSAAMKKFFKNGRKFY